LEAAAVFGFKGNQAGVEEFTFGDDDDIVARREFVTAKNLSNQSFSAISDNGAPQLSGDRYAQASYRALVRKQKHRGITPVNPAAALVHALELRASPNPLIAAEARQNYSELTVRRLRPFARRRLSTRRPFFVAMRTRKPCVRARWRVFGWNVRLPFMIGSARLRRIDPNRQC
jgi:hypothetical protein